jgi:hypothetical protein
MPAQQGRMRSVGLVGIDPVVLALASIPDWTAICSMFRLPFREGEETSTHALFSAMSTFCDLSDSSV